MSHLREECNGQSRKQAARTSSLPRKINFLHHDSTSVVIDRSRTYSDAEYVATILRAWTNSCDTSSQARAIRREVEHFLDLDTRVSPSPNNVLAVACLDCLAALETDPRKFFKEPSFAFDGFVHHKNPRVRWAALRCIIRVYVEYGAGSSHETLLFLIGRSRPSYEFDPDVRARTMECLCRVNAPGFFHAILRDRERTETVAHVLWSLMNDESHFDHRLRLQLMHFTAVFLRTCCRRAISPAGVIPGSKLRCRKGAGNPPSDYCFLVEFRTLCTRHLRIRNERQSSV